MSTLDRLKKYTTIVADTGEIDLISEYKPQDATTNPSLLLKAAKNQDYKYLLYDGVQRAKDMGIFDLNNIKPTLELIAVNFACKILEIIPGRVSIEADASLAFDVDGTIECARRLVQYIEDRGVAKFRVLIKIPSTWEGIQAAKVLEEEGIHCNLTLLFSFSQAIAAAQAGVTLISPFVGRIYDFYKGKTGIDYKGEDDPGVLSVKKIYNFYKKYGYTTEIMGASFRNTGEIKELAGCDLLTISPALLKELSEDSSELERKLAPESAETSEDNIILTENVFRWRLNEDEMATLKLAEGIRRFNSDWSVLSETIVSNYN